MSFCWRYFPVFYVLPFLLATSRVPAIASVSEILRWAVLLAGCGIAVWAGLSRARSKPGMMCSADWIMLGYLGLFLLSAAWSIDSNYTIQRAISMCLLYGSAMWAFWSYADRLSEEYLMRLIVRTLGVVLGINLVVGGLLYPGELLAGRFQGLFSNPNNIGLLASLALPLAAGHWLRNRNRLNFSIVMVIGLSLLACSTRSAMIGSAFAGLLVLSTLAGRRPAWVITIVVSLFVSGFVISQTDFFEEKILREETISTGSNRTFFWELGEDYTDKRPWLGHGFATDAVINEHYGVVLKDLKLRGYGVMSSYHGMAVQIGRPLTYTFFALLWGFIAWCMISRWRDLRLVIYVGTLASGLIVCIFESAIYSAGNCFSFLFWVVFMLAVRRVHYRNIRVNLNRNGGLLGKPRRAPVRARPVPVRVMPTSPV